MVIFFLILIIRTSVLLGNKSALREITLKVGYITGSKRYKNDQQYNRPGRQMQNIFNLALDRLNNLSLKYQRPSELSASINFKPFIVETYGQEAESIKQTIDLMLNQNVSIVIGPQETCITEAKLAAIYNKPMISHFCSHSAVSNKKLYPTFSRTKPPHTKISSSVVATLNHFNWLQDLILLYHHHPTASKSEESQSQQQEFKLIAQSIERQLIGLLNENNLETENAIAFIGSWNKTYHHGYSNNPFRELVKKSFQRGKIFIVVGHYFEHLGLMLALDEHANGRANANTNTNNDTQQSMDKRWPYLVIGVDIEHYDRHDPARYFKGLFSDDGLDITQRAFESYIGIFPSPPLNDDMDNLIVHMISTPAANNKWFPVAHSNNNISLVSSRFIRLPVEAYYLYDAMMLFGQVLKECLAKRDVTIEYCQDGYRLSETIRKQTYNSSMGFIGRIDSNGDAEGNYTLVARERIQTFKASIASNESNQQQQTGGEQDGESNHDIYGLFPVATFVEWLSSRPDEASLSLPKLHLHRAGLDVRWPKLSLPQLRPCTKHIETNCRKITGTSRWYRQNIPEIIYAIMILLCLILVMLIIHFSYHRYHHYYMGMKLEQCNMFVSSEILLSFRQDLTLVPNMSQMPNVFTSRSTMMSYDTAGDCPKLAWLKDNLVTYKKIDFSFKSWRQTSYESRDASGYLSFWRSWLEHAIKLRLNLIRDRRRLYKMNDEREGAHENRLKKQMGSNLSRVILSNLVKLAWGCLKFRQRFSFNPSLSDNYLNNQTGGWRQRSKGQTYEAIQMMATTMKSCEQNNDDTFMNRSASPDAVNHQINKDLNQLLSTMRQIRHANVLPLIGLAYNIRYTNNDSDNDDENKSESNGRLFKIDCFVVCDYVSRGSLRDVLCKKNPLSSSVSIVIIISLINDLLRGLEFLHSGLYQPGYHGNLKATNCLINNRWTLKLADFYTKNIEDSLISNKCYASQASQLLTDDSFKLPDEGVHYEKYVYLAPESLRDLFLFERHNHNMEPNMEGLCGSSSGECRKKCDLYSLGFVLYELLACQEPWSCYFDDNKNLKDNSKLSNVQRYRHIVERMVKKDGASSNSNNLIRPPLDRVDRRCKQMGQRSNVLMVGGSFGSQLTTIDHRATISCTITYDLLAELGTQIIRCCWSDEPSQRPISVSQVRQMLAPVLDYRPSLIANKNNNNNNNDNNSNSNNNGGNNNTDNNNNQYTADNGSMSCDINSAMKMVANNNNSRHNLMDNMLYLMDIYTNNLELIIDERTKQLQMEKMRANKLLDKMLPPVIAEKLCHDEAIQAELFECVTVMFTDIVDFTQISSMSSPIETIEFLNDLYNLFDIIINRYDNIYKVEIIGDCLLLASGVPLRNGLRHACLIASLALDLLDQAKRFTIKHLPDHRLSLRCGIHCGPVCAGLVGSREQPKYSLFGDTINIASRMQSTGLPQKVHLTSQFKTLLLEASALYKACMPRLTQLAQLNNADDAINNACTVDYVIIKRGLVQVKGKGEMLTYWLLNGPRCNRLT